MVDLHTRLVTAVEMMPAFPDSVNKILQMTSDINCSPKDIVQVIDHDPVMTMKILKLVNSAYFGLTRKIISIKHGVVLVGINTIKNMALTIATLGKLPKESHTALDMTDFLLHSLGTATVSRLLGERLNVPSAEAADYFVAGLLHDFGKVVFTQFLPNEFEKALQKAKDNQIPLFEAEMMEIGTDHAQIGGMLGEKWQLPRDLVTCIREHHFPESGGRVSQMCDCVLTANLIVKLKRFGDAGSPVVGEMSYRASERFGMGLDGLNDVLGDITDDLDKSRLFIRL